MSPSDGAIAVIGGGLMGHGIAQVFACAGFDIRLFDHDPQVRAHVRDRIRANLGALGLDRSTAELVRPVAGMAEAVADAAIIFESVREDLATKQAVFAAIEAAAPHDAILATNTSVIPIGEVTRGLARPQRALGTHWWNPPYLVPLVEVVAADATAPATIAATIDLLASVGKLPVHVRRDLPGFIGNRLQHALWREAIALVEQGVCDARTIDLVVKNSFGPRLGLLGPMENADLVGLDLALAVHRYLFPHLARGTTPSPYLERLVEEGHLGMKSGQGLLAWSAEAQAAVKARLTERLRYADPAHTPAA